MFYKSGIYAIINHANNKLYLGQSVKTYTRLNTHKRELKKNTHRNKGLQEDYNSNPKQFEFKVLFQCPVDDLNYYEALMIQEAIKQGFEVYNIILNPFKELTVKVEEYKQNYKDYFGVESSEDVKVTILKNELNKLK
jgi:group I intron endonuclease